MRPWPVMVKPYSTVPLGAAACARSMCPVLTELALTPGASPLRPRPMVRMEPLILQRLIVMLSARICSSVTLPLLYASPLQSMVVGFCSLIVSWLTLGSLQANSNASNGMAQRMLILPARQGGLQDPQSLIAALEQL